MFSLPIIDANHDQSLSLVEFEQENLGITNGFLMYDVTDQIEFIDKGITFPPNLNNYPLLGSGLHVNPRLEIGESSSNHQSQPPPYNLSLTQGQYSCSTNW